MCDYNGSGKSWMTDNSRSRKKGQPASFGEVYSAYLLRMERDGVNESWRYTLKSRNGQEQFAFPNLDELFSFLWRRSHEQPFEDEEPEEPP
jgi:hypothetical protein